MTTTPAGQKVTGQGMGRELGLALAAGFTAGVGIGLLAWFVYTVLGWKREVELNRGVVLDEVGDSAVKRITAKGPTFVPSDDEFTYRLNAIGNVNVPVDIGDMTEAQVFGLLNAMHKVSPMIDPTDASYPDPDPMASSQRGVVLDDEEADREYFAGLGLDMGLVGEVGEWDVDAMPNGDGEGRG